MGLLEIGGLLLFIMLLMLGGGVWIAMTLAIVAQVAAEDPDTEPKIPQPKIVVCINRPGTFESQGDKPSNICSDSFVL